MTKRADRPDPITGTPALAVGEDRAGEETRALVDALAEVLREVAVIGPDEEGLVWLSLDGYPPASAEGPGVCLGLYGDPWARKWLAFRDEAEAALARTETVRKG